MNAPPHDSPRTLAHRYEVGELLGRGGMASVHLGRDTRLGRQVAIKMLRADLARDPSFHARFRREAQSAAALNHPSIVAVYDTGEDVHLGPGGTEEHTPFIVMEYVQGRTLREILHRGEGAVAHLAAGPDVATQISAPPTHTDTGGGQTHALEVGEAAKMTAGVLSALEYSHRAGIVHRDIKPANVMVTPNGDIKVMDFGIARAVADASATMTQTHAVIGTAQYLSPEQARGETVDARSDLYSAGCLLYELLTGRPPFIGDSPVSVALQHVREAPEPPSTLNPQVPEALDRVVLKALAKDREDRYPDAQSFRTDLLAAVSGRAVSAPPVAAAVAAPTQAIPADEPTAAFSTRGANPGQTVTIGRVDDEPEQQRGRAAGYVGLALAVLAVFALVAWAVSQLIGGVGDDDTVTVPVPAVVDLDRAAAKQAIEGAGLTYREGEPVNSEKPANTVVSQDPVENTPVPEGTEVTVVLSLGPAEVTVPDLTGMTEAAAQAALAREGLKLGEVTRQDHPDAPRDTVISSSPEAGASVGEGTAVNIVVSTGQVELPDLTGKTTAEARRILLELNLEVNLTYENSTATPDTVIRQDPGPGKVPQASVVNVVAAQAPPPPTTTTTPPPTTTSVLPTPTLTTTTG